MGTTTWFVSCLELTTTTSSSTHHCAESAALSLELVWDDEEWFNGVAKCHSEVAQKLLLKCELIQEREELSHPCWFMVGD
ncbi:E3 ubiquitin-protein ligase [Sesbania bispinosa]|nr:E3 ubiquitin-protein ligase [Sesbania bispinosa]